MASGSSSRESSRTTPWSAQQPYLRDLYSRAEQVFAQGPYEYGPSRVAGFDPAQRVALARAEERGLEGSPVTRAAQGEVERTLRGEYLDPSANPALQRFSEMGQRNLRRGYYDTINRLGSRLEAAGRTGSGAHAVGTQVAGENLATGMADLEARIYGGAYEGERGRMMGALGQAAPVAEMDYRDISAVMGAGGARQQQRQAQIDDIVARFQQKQYGMAEKLAEFSRLIGEPVQEQRGRGRSQSWGALWG